MPKYIIYCADGTWNGPGQDDNDDKDAKPTNVFKTYLNLAGVDSAESLRLADEQERVLTDATGQVTQIAKYLHGVGDSDNFLVKVLGGTLGAGLITRIVRGYTFVSRNYVAGDQIVLIGFSRGAYTARALGGLIVARGLLDSSRIDLNDKEKSYRLGAAVWYDYRRQALGANPSLFGKLQESVVDLPGFLTRPPTADLIPDVTIEAIAVWDTVGSLGIPQYTSDNQSVDAFRFADTRLSSKVRHGLHAIAVDEQRANFTPTLWDADSRITQTLFPGAHADVGGGYPQTNNESGLSDGALRWMTEELRKIGVLYTEPPTYIPQPDPKAVAHRPWLDVLWKGLPRAPRQFPSGMLVAQSVLDRISGGLVVADPGTPAQAYQPANLGNYIAANQTLPGIGTVRC